MSKIGIIGASGFIGSNLMHHLKNNTEYNLIPTSRQPRDGFLTLNLKQGALLTKFVSESDTIIYLAHDGGPNRATPINIEIDRNIPPLQQIITEIKKQDKNNLKLIYMSSGGTAYGISKDKKPWKESDPLFPVSSYGQAKIRAEKLIEMAVEYGICRGICIRASNPFGNQFEHQKPQGVIDVIIARLNAGQPFSLFYPAETVRDFIHMDDLNRAFVAALKHETKFDVFNIGSGIGTSLSEVIEKIEKFFGKKLEVLVLPTNENVTQVPWSVLNIEHAKKTLKWSPQVLLEDGLLDLIKRKLVK